MCEGIDLTKKHYPLDYICKVCLTSKGRRLPHNYLIKLRKHKMDLIYLDVVGLMPVLGYDKS